MASPSTVISEGFGSWGSVNLLITDGYGIGVAQTGGRICATVTIFPAVSGTAKLFPAASGTITIKPTVTATAGTEEC